MAAALATAWAITVLPGRRGPAARGEVVRLSRSWFLCPRSSPLLTGALLVGLASSVYWTFAVEHLQRPGGLSTIQSQIVLAVVGLASVGGSAGADVVGRLGARGAFTLAAGAEAASLLLLGLAPGTLGDGPHRRRAVRRRVQHDRRRPGHLERPRLRVRPSAGLAAVMVMHAIGLLVGAPLFGAVADGTGLAAVFVAGAALLTGAAAFAPPRRLAGR